MAEPILEIYNIKKLMENANKNLKADAGISEASKKLILGFQEHCIMDNKYYYCPL